MDLNEVVVGGFYIYYGKGKDKFLIEVLERSSFRDELYVYEHMQGTYVTASINDFSECAVASRAEILLYSKNKSLEDHIQYHKNAVGRADSVRWKRHGNQMQINGTFTSPGGAGGGGGAGNGVYMITGVGGGGGGGSGGAGAPSKGGSQGGAGGLYIDGISLKPGELVKVKI